MHARWGKEGKRRVARTKSNISEMNKTLRIDFAYAGERVAGGWAMVMGSSWLIGCTGERKENQNLDIEQGGSRGRSRRAEKVQIDR